MLPAPGVRKGTLRSPATAHWRRGPTRSCGWMRRGARCANQAITCRSRSSDVLHAVRQVAASVASRLCEYPSGRHQRVQDTGTDAERRPSPCPGREDEERPFCSSLRRAGWVPSPCREGFRFHRQLDARQEARPGFPHRLLGRTTAIAAGNRYVGPDQATMLPGSPDNDAFYAREGEESRPHLFERRLKSHDSAELPNDTPLSSSDRRGCLFGA
jgi:hypothetical protein